MENETMLRKREFHEEDEVPWKFEKYPGTDEDASGSDSSDEENEEEKKKVGAMKYRSAPVKYKSKPKVDVRCQMSVALRKSASVSMGITGALDMIDTFDRPGDAFAVGTYAGAGTFANGCEDKPGQRIPKAGLYAAAGVGHAKAEFSVFEAEAKGPNASAGVGASAGSLSAGAFATAEVASASASAGPLKASVGLAVDTGVNVGLTGAEFKVLGTGVSVGRKTGFSIFGTGLEINFW